MEDFIRNLITAFLGSGIAIAAVNFIFDHIRERRRKADSTKYLALRLAFYFEEYAIQCADKVVAHQTAVEHDGNAGRYLGEVPTLSPLPESDAYQLIDRSILNDVLDFSQRRHMADGAAEFYWDIVGDLDCFRVSIEENTLKMGSRAIKIAQKLRNFYKLDDRKLTFEKWDIDSFFMTEIKKLGQIEEKRKKDSEERGSIVAPPK